MGKNTANTNKPSKKEPTIPKVNLIQNHPLILHQKVAKLKGVDNITNVWTDQELRKLNQVFDSGITKPDDRITDQLSKEFRSGIDSSLIKSWFRRQRSLKREENQRIIDQERKQKRAVKDLNVADKELTSL